MKKLSKTFLSFLLIFCSIFLIACNKNNKTDLDYKVNVNIQSSNYQIEEDKTLISNLSDPTSESYLDISEFEGFKFSLNIKTNETEIVDATGILKKANETDIELAIKLSAEMEVDQKINIQGYFKNNTIYINTGDEKYYCNFNDLQEDENLSILDEISNISNLNIQDLFELINPALELETSVLQIAEETSNSKSIKKFKLSYPAEYNAELYNEFVVVLENNKFTGLYFSTELSETSLITINLIPYEKNIQYPSFNNYTQKLPDEF